MCLPVTFPPGAVIAELCKIIMLVFLIVFSWVLNNHRQPSEWDHEKY
jgi:hypothetical protein